MLLLPTIVVGRFVLLNSVPQRMVYLTARRKAGPIHLKSAKIQFRYHSMSSVYVNKDFRIFFA